MIDVRIFTKDKVNNAGSAGRSFRSGSAYADVSARISAIEAALSGKVDTAFWDRIFRAHGRGEDSDGNMVARDVAPNDVGTEITDIESLVSLWTTGGITALGTGPVGTGSNGGTGSLGSLLVSLNDSGLSLPAAGGYLHYNGSAWEWTEGGGESVDLSNYLQKRTYLDANGFYKNNHYYRLEDEGANVTIATRTWVKNELGNTDLTDYIKKNTVAEVDSLKRGDYFYNLPVVKDNVTLADRDWVSSQISGLADRDWVSSQISGLGAGTVTSVGTVSNVPGLTLTGGPITVMGTVTLGLADGYVIPTSGQLDSISKAISDQASIIKRLSSEIGAVTGATWWGQPFEYGPLDGDMYDVGGINMYGSIYCTTEKDQRWLMFRHSGVGKSVYYGFGGDHAAIVFSPDDIPFYTNLNEHIQAFYVSPNGDVEIGRQDHSIGLKIGDGYLTWDEANKAIKVSYKDNFGTMGVASLYATGGISALGIGSTNASAIDLTFRSVTAGGVVISDHKISCSGLTIDGVDSVLSIQSNGEVSISGGAGVSINAGGPDNCITLNNKVDFMGALFTKEGTHLYITIDNVKYELNKTQA